MNYERIACAYEATLRLGEGTGPAAPGAAVTTKLCGRVAHGGPCKWPHNSAIDTSRSPARFRTVYACHEQERDGVARRIETALRGSADWTVEAAGQRPVTAEESELAARLLEAPTPPPQ